MVEFGFLPWVKVWGGILKGLAYKETSLKLMEKKTEYFTQYSLKSHFLRENVLQH